MLNLKNINIGSLIEMRWKEMEISTERTCNFLNCTEEEINRMFKSESLNSDTLLRWSKLLEYDFFRLYSQHIILFSPKSSGTKNKVKRNKSTTLEFRKNIYTKEIIDFILELLKNKQKTKLQIIEEYRIPKTTLYKWIKKYETTKL